MSQNGNRTSTSGQAAVDVKSRTSQQLTNLIPAGGVLPIPVFGNTFYVVVATAAIEIRPSNGVFNTYETGTGLDLDLSNSFSMLEIKNPHAFDVVFQIFVGFDRLVDKRLILNQGGQGQIAYPTYPTPNSLNNVEIVDRAAQVITDFYGNEFYALQRVAIVVFNTDAGVTYLLQKTPSVVANGPAIGAVPPLTAIRFEVGGNYCLNVGGGMINAIVHEVYTVLRKTVS